MVAKDRSLFTLIVEILAAISIIASLTLVSFELSESVKAARSASASDVAISLSSWYTQVGIEEKAGKFFVRAMRDPDTLSTEEMADFIFLLHGGMFLYQNAFVLGREGSLDKTLQTVTTGTLKAIVNQPGFTVYWRQRRSLYIPEFQEYIKELQLRGEKTDSSLIEIYQ